MCITGWDVMCRISCTVRREGSMDKGVEKDYSMYRSKYHSRRAEWHTHLPNPRHSSPRILFIKGQVEHSSIKFPSHRLHLP